MKVLVAYATVAGSTAGVAERIAGSLQAGGHEVVVCAVDEVTDPQVHDAFVVGSAVRDQAWLPSGAAFLAQHRKALYGKPVWLFSVGLPGALRGPLRKWVLLTEADVLAALLDDVEPIEHRLFSGVVTPGAFGWFGAFVFRAVGGRFGDFRDWAAIEKWSTGIADALVDIEAASR
ncbi:menaquinone-dependent protoporphyrinogen oxidase [Lentzea waywayandensis]|uniref:Menaquinone-dependent protoporphyrinogen oxidase n=1 Tax=Lentzea waywayandensis TaxID=84724 RepID=A0A1I6DC52_9PSEU|nr:flavodoxin domain-containing protein [Lentzea waywayandensis]SFR03036.1 menaquinone-dependent protoporphyrinogen oxidase [Lentzea waywayandensis]